MAQLVKDFETNRDLEFLFFWGHSSSDSDAVGKTCLSQWYDAGFECQGTFYKTAEHWMMAKKAELFSDKELRQSICDCDSPKESKELGRKVRFFSDDLWNEHKFEIVIEGNLYKFCQNPRLFEYLKSTGNAYLVEASPNDSVWGIGISENDEEINNPYMWRGENLLGFALMAVREKLDALQYYKPIENPKLPYWLKYADIEDWDLALRNGEGLAYLEDFNSWFDSLSKTDQHIYEIMFPRKYGWEE